MLRWSPPGPRPRLTRWEAGATGRAHQEGGADPDEGGYGVEVGCLTQLPELALPDAFHLFQEAGLPGIQFQHLDAAQDLIHQPDA